MKRDAPPPEIGEGRGTDFWLHFSMAFGLQARLQAQDYGDTPYVQTPQNVVDRMLEVAKVGPKDFVIDLGSGDGRMVITAAQKYGARGFGVDLDRRLVTLSNRLAAKAGVADRAVFYERDIYQTDLSPATVVTIYLLPEVNLMMRPRLLSMLKPGTRVVSHDYDMGEWPPDLTFTMDAPGKPVGRDKKSKVFYWVVPGKASGKWRWQSAGEGRAAQLRARAQPDFPENRRHADRRRQDGADRGREARRRPGELCGRGSSRPEAGALRVQRPHRQQRARRDRARGRAGAAAQRWSAARTEVWEPRHFALPAPTLIPPQVQ